MASRKTSKQTTRDMAATRIPSTEHLICALSYYINHFPPGQYKPHYFHDKKWKWPLWVARRILSARFIGYQMCLPRYWARNLDRFGLREVRWGELNPDLCLEDFTIIEFANNHKRLVPAVQAWLRRDEIPPEAKTFTPQKRGIPTQENKQKENKLTYKQLPSGTKQAIWDRLKEMQ